MGKGDITKFKDKGFHTWQTKVKGHLMKKNLWSIVKPNPAGEEGTSTRASTAQTRDRDEQALGIIITSLDDAYIHYIDEATTAQQAWGILEQMFGAKGKRSRIGLKMQLYKLTLNANEDIASLINRLQSIITQLVYIQAPVDEEDKVAVLLNALPKEYDQLSTVLQEKEPAPKLIDAVNSIQEESKKINKGASTSKGEAFLVSSKPRRCKICKRTNHDTKDCYSKKTCTICKKTGHPTDKCYFKDKDKSSKKDKGKAHIIEESDDEAHFVYESNDDIL